MPADGSGTRCSAAQHSEDLRAHVGTGPQFEGAFNTALRSVLRASLLKQFSDCGLRDPGAARGRDVVAVGGAQVVRRSSRLKGVTGRLLPQALLRLVCTAAGVDTA
ncbi:hypothetical protein GCM10010478_09940 [Streptomyces erythrogriseus]|uniref:Uncharacterized protein n=1 Tax=Streptomyces erythrogriseus TaxID=284027 RepID=A0ABN3WF24_9ACTN